MKDLRIYIVIGSVLLLVYILAQYNKPKVTDWSPTYLTTEKAPFGTYILRNRIHDLFPKSTVQQYREPVYNVLSAQGEGNDIYFIICNDVNINEYDYNKLVRFVSAGGQVFIAAKSFGSYLEKKLKFSVDSDYDKGSSIHFVNHYLDSSDVYATDKKIGSSYFDEIDTAKTLVLAQNTDHKSNFIKFTMGKGALYLNTTPLMFTNYSILQYKGGKYVSQAISYIKPGNHILWDEYYTRGRYGDESLMRVFLQHAPLRSAFYITLFSLLLFVLYEMKRRQRVIPVIAPLNNSTLDFAKVVGQVYYEQHDNLNIAQKKINYFLEYVRTRYNLKTNNLNKEFTGLLTQKSGVSPEVVKNLIDQFVAIGHEQLVSDAQLINLNYNIEQFYTQSS